MTVTDGVIVVVPVIVAVSDCDVLGVGLDVALRVCEGLEVIDWLHVWDNVWRPLTGATEMPRNVS